MERQENDDNTADIKATIKLETDIEERMPCYSGNEDNETVKLESDIYVKEEQPNSSYIEANIMEFEEEAVTFIKPERSDPVESDSEEQEEDIEMKEVQVLKFDKFTCVVCDRVLGRSVPLGACKDSIEPNGNKFMCIKCRLDSRFKLIENNYGVHRKLKKYKCEECDSAFTQRTPLKVHVQTVHRKLKHTCQQCNKIFSNRDYLYKHVNFTHRRLNILTCDLCNKEFPNQTQFRRHINEVHRRIKEFECEECKHAFVSVHLLTQHVNTVHRKLKPFACDKCSRSFASRSVLRRHRNSVHLKIKYTCAECSKAFTLKFNLISHINVIHRKIKQFVCAICKYAFGRKIQLKKHMTFAKCQLNNIKQSEINRRR